jgi:predicted AlkP superfamily pyrophosphatase or phosphodiesterase
MTMRILLLAGFLLAQFPGSAQSPAKDRMVVVVSLDGFRASALEDPRLPVPTIRKLAREGAFGARMTGFYPTVTWPAHTTLITGVPPARHGVLFNGILTRTGTDTPPKVEPWRPQPEMVKAPTVYELAHRAGLTTAEVDWVAIYQSPFITWAFPEVPNPDGKIETEMVAAGVLSRQDVAEFRKGTITWRDHIWTEAAAHILRKHRPNLMLYHTLNLDSTNHRYGPGSLASLNAMEYADKQVGQLVEAVRSAGLLERTTFLVLSDHGFRVVKKLIHANALLKANGLITGNGAAVRCEAWAVPEGGTAMVYVTDPRKRAELVPKLKPMLAGVEGVTRVYEPPEFPALGLPVPDKYDQMADLLVAAQPGYAFTGGVDGAVVADAPAGTTPGTHGYLASDPEMDTFLIAWGKGAKRGARLSGVRSVDVAPTIARILGLKMTDAAGRALTEAVE